MSDNNEKIQLTVDSKYDGWRVDKFLAVTHPEFSRSVWQKLIKDGKVAVAGRALASGNTKIESGDIVDIEELPKTDHSTLPQAEDIPLDIVFEDKDLIVINKLAGMVVHPADGNEQGTVVNALLARYANFIDDFEDKQRPGIVHRLDKETSGLLLIAKNRNTLERLIAMFKDREIRKTYLALIHDHPRKSHDTINHAIGRHPVNRKKMAGIINGKHAVTHFGVISQGVIDNQPISLLEVQIETGRTHQIRVHLSEIHLPIIGDKLYGGGRREPYAPRPMLHAWELEFKHPFTGKVLKFTAPIPEDMQELIDRIK